MTGAVLYIAIDFGTSYSGYAFSFQTKLLQDPVRISCWKTVNGYKTFKTPTCILFDEHQQFLKFGYDAMITYTRSSKQQAKEQYLFEHFKMELYDKEIHRDMMLTAGNGKQMKAMTVFSASLLYLKDDALKKIEEKTAGKKFIASDVTWVLTVPAIWPPAAKQFMREAAIEAGLVKDSEPQKLVFALEPEAASVFCKQLPSDGFIAEGICEDTLEQTPGTQYMVVDCGGGTIDITVHEVLKEGHLKELHAASGNDMGGQTVDRKLISFLKDVFTAEIFMKFELEYPAEALELKYQIAQSKSNDGGTTLIHCPVSLQKLAGGGGNIERSFKGVHGAEWDDGAILIEHPKLKSFFDDSLRATADKIKQIMKKTELNIEYMLLVGGYAESPILREFMKKHFSSCKVLCPEDPQAVIMKGAILYGKQPKVVESRVSALTYGLCVNKLFNELTHKGKSKYVNSEGRIYCNVCFEKLVGKGQSVHCDEVQTFTFHPTDSNQTAVRFQFYSTNRTNVKFVDEWGLEPIGCFTVQMPKTGRGLNREIRLEIKFGSTEMKATATDIDSKETESIKLDFMSES